MKRYKHRSSLELLVHAMDMEGGGLNLMSLMLVGHKASYLIVSLTARGDMRWEMAPALSLHTNEGVPAIA